MAGRRSALPLDGGSPLSVFEAVEAEVLLALPRKEFVLATWSAGIVGPHIHVKIGKALYSVPWRHNSRRVDGRSAGDVVKIFELIATHVRTPTMGKQTDFSQYLPEKIGFKIRTLT